MEVSSTFNESMEWLNQGLNACLPDHWWTLYSFTLTIGYIQSLISNLYTFGYYNYSSKVVLKTKIPEPNGNRKSISYAYNYIDVLAMWAIIMQTNRHYYYSANSATPESTSCMNHVSKHKQDNYQASYSLKLHRWNILDHMKTKNRIII